jgi:prevent-host-death family protein
MRELSRSTASVIEAARSERRPTVVTLRGRPAVLLLPLDRWRVDLGSVAPDPAAETAAAERVLKIAALSDLERRVFDALEDRPLAPDRIARKGEIDQARLPVALARLEIAGLAAKSTGGFRRTI